VQNRRRDAANRFFTPGGRLTTNSPGTRFTGAGDFMECSTSTTAKRRDVIARVFGQNGRLVNTGDDVREAASALRRDPRKRVC